MADSYGGRVEKGELESIWEHWKEVMESPRSKLDLDRRKAIKARLNDGYSVSDLCDAINGCRASDFHQGANQYHRKYRDISLICRDGLHVDQFIETWESAVSAAQAVKGQQEKLAEAKASEVSQVDGRARVAEVIALLKKGK